MAERQDKVIIGRALIEKNKKLLGQALVEKRVINEHQLNEALKVQARTRELLGAILIKMGHLTEEDVARAIADSFDLDYIDLEEAEVESNALESIPSALARRHGVLPLWIENNTLHIACDKPPPVQVLGNLRRLTGKQIVIHIATTSPLWALLKDAYEGADISSSTAASSSTNPLLAEVAEEEADIEQSVIQLLDEFVAKALRDRASDIHFESAKERLRVRFRVDGILREVETYPPEISPPLVSRIKVLSNLNIAEKRAPQDGGFTFENPFQTVDIRVSILPNIYGEKAVLRLLTAEKEKIDFEHLGMETDTSQLFMSLLKRPHGLILIAGPTGSGKSTTLYASLLSIRSPEVNITTVEDPVEYKIGDITQVQVDQARKITFDNALRSILRQDPDIIMVGEIRDRETAEISLQAALTGHLVLATIHTNDAPSALVRLVEMGCEPFLVSSAVSGVMSQRLVRINCESCKEAFEPTPIELKRFGYSKLPEGGQWARSSGCRRCDNTGYRGRIGIFECFKMDKTIRQEVIKESSAEKIREIVLQNGMRPLLEDGLLKVNSGQTTPEEILRVTVLE
ncbi:MAG: type II/IV secretion system protein [Deltaproteobacteria bacterium]|nr:type II/IV secretion system protein [Deltaproteobacteria bacterium]MBW2020513.1 type II/IV secretion system protein [Deltaproteobacteria bacterium]MBW2075458.1 type II/IV secretion system protein [Deltaproteobacteria bacterium]RLB83459.1 MAG: type II secretion system protein GspE [Deltaproteobacteria bacterium]